MTEKEFFVCFFIPSSIPVLCLSSGLVPFFTLLPKQYTPGIFKFSIPHGELLQLICFPGVWMGKLGMDKQLICIYGEQLLWSLKKSIMSRKNKKRKRKPALVRRIDLKLSDKALSQVFRLSSLV